MALTQRSHYAFAAKGALLYCLPCSYKHLAELSWEELHDNADVKRLHGTKDQRLTEMLFADGHYQNMAAARRSLFLVRVCTTSLIS